jgi:polyisoprenoid-binding protein YceI
MTAPARVTAEELFSKLSAGSLDGTWTLDPTKSTVSIQTKTFWNMAKVNGTFTSVQGEAAVLATSVTAKLSIATGSLDTKNAKRDKHLASDDFFSSATYPQMLFVLTDISPTATATKVEGTLTVKGKTRPITFDASVSAAGTTQMTVDATVELDRSDYGIDWNKMGMVAMACTATIKAVFTRD